MNTHNINYSTKTNTKPLIIRLCIIILLTFCNSFSYSQKQINSNSITSDFENIQKNKNDSILIFFKNQKKKSWLNILPNFNYDLKNQSFNVGISLNSFASFYQQKQRNKIEVEKLKNILETKLNNNLDKLNLELEKFYFDCENLKNKIEIFKIDSKLFQITKGKYKNSEIPTENFLQLKKAFLINKKHLFSELFKLKYSAKKIVLKTKNKTLFKIINQLEIKLNDFQNSR